MAQSINATSSSSGLPLKALVRLGRLKEHLVFSLPLTWLGALVANPSLDTAQGLLLLVAVAAANILAVTYAFMINDIADAPDDALHPESAGRNPIAKGEIDLRTAWIASYAVALASALLFIGVALVQESWGVLIVGLLNVLLSDLYSRKSVRLKAWPIIDVVSHVMMLGGFLVLTSYYTFSTTLNEFGWLAFLVATLGSVYGQLYNQIRDYDTDKLEAGLRNTTILLGKRLAATLQIVAGLTALGLLAWSWYRGVFPGWMPLLTIGLFIIAVLVYHPGKDMSGKEPTDASGGLQQQFWIAINIAVFIWLIYEIAVQFGVLAG